MNNFFIGILFFILSGFIASIFRKENKIKILSILCFVGSLFCLTPAVSVLFSGQNLITECNFNPIFGTINFTLDPLSAFFVVVISVMSLMGVIYSKS